MRSWGTSSVGKEQSHRRKPQKCFPLLLLLTLRPSTHISAEINLKKGFTSLAPRVGRQQPEKRHRMPREQPSALSLQLLIPTLFWFKFEAVLFLENPKVQQPCAGSFSGAPNRTQSTIRRQNPIQRDRKKIPNLFTGACILMFDMYIYRLKCAIAPSRARCAAAAGNHNYPALRPRRGLTHPGWARHLSKCLQTVAEKETFRTSTCAGLHET